MTEKKAHFSFTKSLYDDCSLAKKDQESTGPFQYMMDPVHESKDNCWQNESPFMHNHFNSIPVDHVDIESELRNQTRHLSKCPEERYDPTKLENCKSCKKCNEGLPCDCKHCKETKFENRLRDCNNGLIPSYTRINRSCNVLSGITINRFDPLCENPQNIKTIQSNSYIGSNTRLNVKDAFKSTQEEELKKKKQDQKRKDEEEKVRLLAQLKINKEKEKKVINSEYKWSWGIPYLE